MASTAKQVPSFVIISGGGMFCNLNGGFPAKAGPVLKHMSCPDKTVSKSLARLHGYDIRNTPMPGFSSYGGNRMDKAKNFIQQIQQPR